MKTVFLAGTLILFSGFAQAAQEFNRPLYCFSKIKEPFQNELDILELRSVPLTTPKDAVRVTIKYKHSAQSVAKMTMWNGLLAYNLSGTLESGDQLNINVVGVFPGDNQTTATLRASVRKITADGERIESVLECIP